MGNRRLWLAALSIAIIWSLTLRVQQAQLAAQPTLMAWMLDVGQGEAVLLREPGGKLLLFDGGPDDSVLSQIGAVLPPWQREIDIAVLSHNHADHIRGLISVLMKYRVKEVWISGAVHGTADFDAFKAVLASKRILVKTVYFDPAACRSGPCPPPIAFGGSTLQIYHPLSDMVGKQPANQHDATVIVKATYANRSLLLTGDIDEAHERRLLAACPPPNCSLAVSVLQIPHHGSGSGLSPQFLAAIAPEIALIPVGVDNKFHHPRENILQLLGNNRIPIYRTDTDGRIFIKMRVQGMAVAVQDSS